MSHVSTITAARRWLPVALALALAACSRPEAPQEPIRSVKLLTVGAGSVTARAEYAGEVRARTESRLGFRVGGKLVQRPAEVGQRVQAGQLLARLDARVDFRLEKLTVAIRLVTCRVRDRFIRLVGARDLHRTVAAMDDAVEQLRRAYGASELVLVGYSGGGAVASLVAARREDVDQLITVAGNLDHQVWTQDKHLSPLEGSLNPSADWQHLQRLPQTHFIGAQDSIISPAVARAYAAHFPPSAPLKIRTIEAFDHHCCWVEQWPALLKEALLTRPADSTPVDSVRH